MRTKLVHLRSLMVLNLDTAHPHLIFYIFSTINLIVTDLKLSISEIMFTMCAHFLCHYK